jgi:phage tail-like protein
MNGTSWLLGSGYPWYSGSSAAEHPGLAPSAVVANVHSGLSLASLPSGPLGLASPDDSLGQLTLPRGVAVENDSMFILSQDGTLVYRYDALNSTLVPLPHVGAQGLCGQPDDATFLEPRRFRNASAIAVLHGALYVADPAAHRVQVFDLRTVALLRTHEGFDDPSDVASSQNAVYILDRGAGRVYRTTPTRDALTLVIDLSAPHGGEQSASACRAFHWNRLAVDRNERIYLRYRSGCNVELDVFDLRTCLPLTHACERLFDSAQVRDRFAPPLITMDAHGAFELPEHLLDPCGLRCPLAESVPRWEVAERLYVVDPNTRALHVFLPDGRLRHKFGPLDSNALEVQADSADAWSPADLVVHDGCAIILDERYQTVYAHRYGEGVLQKWFSAPADSECHWQHIAEDGTGCLLLWDGTGDIVDRFDPTGQRRGTTQLRTVHALFNRPKSAKQPAADRGHVLLTRSGAYPRPAKVAPSWSQPRYEQHGVWTSQWLDSDLYDCTWHLIEVSIARLPPGSSVVVRTRTSNDAQQADEVSATLGSVGALGSWRDTPALVALAQPDPKFPQCFERDVLVPSGSGQYLQLQIVLTGNGVETPVVDHVRILFPRESLLQYLPAIYSSPPEQGDFLDRFLSIVQTTWSGIEREVDTFERFLDPDSVPPKAMPYLAGWLDLRLEGTWGPEQNRRLLQAMPRLRSKWGTVDGLREWLRVYLSNLGAIEEHDLEQLGVPGIVESFVERRRLMLADGGATLGSADGLWSPAVQRRFQVGVFDREGEVELVSTGDPQVDVFRHYAHSFRVYVPAVLVRTPDDEALIRRAIDLQKPAHATYELVLVEPRLRIGEQSTIELDTIIGEPLPGPLLCPANTDAPSRPPYQRLGFDTMLGCKSTCDGGSRLERSLA